MGFPWWLCRVKPLNMCLIAGVHKIALALSTSGYFISALLPFTCHSLSESHLCGTCTSSLSTAKMFVYKQWNWIYKDSSISIFKMKSFRNEVYVQKKLLSPCKVEELIYLFDSFFLLQLSNCLKTTHQQQSFNCWCRW